MKLNVDQDAARVLRDLVADNVTPGSEQDQVLAKVKRQLDVNLSEVRQLTTDELNSVLAAVVDQEETLAKLGNPTAAQQRRKATLQAAVPKLEAMRDRQLHIERTVS